MVLSGYGRRTLLIGVVSLLGMMLVGCSGLGVLGELGGGNVTPVPGEAPDFSLNDLNGQRVTLSQFRGKPVLLNFWASWCGPCQMEIPDIQALHQAHSNGDAIILAVDYGEPASTARSFVEQRGLTFRVLTDEDSSVGRLYRVPGIPTTFFVNTQGKIVGSHVGPMTRGEAEKALAAAAES